MGGSSGGGDTTTTNEPWSGQQPYLRDIFSAAQDIYRQGFGQEYYPGQQVASFTPGMEQGLGMLQSAAYGTPQQQQFGQYLSNAFQNPYQQAGVGMEFGGVPQQGGGFGESTQPGVGASPALGADPMAGFDPLAQNAPGAMQNFSGNPYLDQMFNTVAQRSGEQFNEQVMPGIASMFGGAGRTGSGIQQEMAGNAASDFQRNLMQAGGDIYGGAYENAMGRDIQRRQLGADIGKTGAALSPSFQGMQQQNIQNMLQSGQITQAQAQQLINAEQQKFDFYQQAPYNALGQYGGLVTGMGGNYGTQTQEGGGGGTNRMSSAMGGAMAGNQIMPGWGAAVGGGLGYLMG